MIKPTAATAFHAAGMATTALAAHTAVNYLQNYSPDYLTALGFSAVISGAVFFGWAFTLSSKTKTRLIPMLAFSLLTTVVSGYTVYQSSIMPLQAAAITAAAEKDKPRLEAFQQQQATYQANRQNLQTILDDLRRQNLADEQTIPTITGKGADWKKQQLRNKIADRNTTISDLTTQQSKLSSPAEFAATQPEPLAESQTLPMLARAFAFELIAVMFMLFASFSKADRLVHEKEQVQQIEAVTKEAKATIQTLENLFRHAEKCRNDVGMDVGMMSECSKEEKTPEHVHFLLKNRLMKPNEHGNFTTAIIMEKANVGERKANQLQDEWSKQGIIQRIKAGRGYTYRYPQPNTDNVFKLRSAS